MQKIGRLFLRSKNNLKLLKLSQPKNLQFIYNCNFSKIKINDETSDEDFKPVQKQTINDENIQSKIDSWVKDNKVVLFMKGTPQMPMCGYSNFVVEVLKFYKIKDYFSVDILSDETIRKEVKAYSNWPTYPQLYINGELVGGSDIVNEMHKEGSLKTMLQEAGVITE
ncbi:Thioredoxin-like fold [Pseudocohnilembus persalinus]|uniref:Thioredoxin-like fold n=1 Tax=Pseudocohnilembus persalinus TaxID=266149 RepID=A0A0V0R8C2_PSEPJ|nr:Thioredoxin-like fold [Pseudocohnilembus persalinus]|eukprot:KRX10743.1 Thioredoxin-like fold [Pseudocohnilembus persalinus]